MYVGAERFHAVIAQEQQPEGIEVAGNREVLKLDRGDGHAALEERQSQAINVAEMLVAARRITALEHERIADQHAEARGSAIPFTAFLLHVIERVHHRLQLPREIFEHLYLFLLSKISHPGR